MQKNYHSMLQNQERIRNRMPQESPKPYNGVDPVVNNSPWRADRSPPVHTGEYGPDGLKYPLRNPITAPVSDPLANPYLSQHVQSGL